MRSAFIASFIDALKKTFSIKGRTSRAQYLQWHFIAINLIVIITLLLNPKFSFHRVLEIICTYFFWGVIMIPYIALQMRRCHDLGHSGWLIIFNIIPFLLFLYLLFSKGDAEANHYGPPVNNKKLTLFDKAWLYSLIVIYLLYALYDSLQVPAP